MPGDIEIICSVGGAATITLGDKLYPCSRGTVSVIPPYKLHSIHTTPAYPHNNYFVHFDVQPVYLLDRLAELLRPTEVHSAARVESFAQIEESMRRIEREFEVGGPGALEAVTAGLRAIVIALARERYDVWRAARPKGKLDPGGSATREAIDRAVAIMARDLGQPLSVDALATESGLGRSSLFQHFQDAFGLSPMRFFRWMRLRQAGVLLATSECSVKEIAAELGFSSPYHFSESFKQQYGLSPSAYRA